MEEKKGTGQSPAPKRDKQVDYSRISSLCLGIVVISLTIVLVAYVKGVSGAVYMGLGMMFASVMVEIVMSTEEDNND